MPATTKRSESSEETAALADLDEAVATEADAVAEVVRARHVSV
jgi:hypothetical protein